ncbi:MAG: right-handed parallel beta-helix repeat-containing protein [Planctomycetes bacterium]|nr:right-handed parallel beta-helix repeat-containing protein [Planctomycetota bacterium]
MTVGWGSGDEDITVVGPTVLLFDSGNYDVEQTVVLAAAKDGDVEIGQALICLSGVDFADTSVRVYEKEVIYVDGDATGGNDGTSWDNAFVYLQAGLAASEPGCRVRVAEGTYRPDMGTPDYTPGDTAATFMLKFERMALEGGYAGFGALDPNERDVGKYETILSGYYGGGVHSEVVVSGKGGTEKTTILDGFTITQLDELKGYGIGQGMTSSGRLTILNCRFSDNYSSEYNGCGLNNSGELVLIGCTFENNRSIYGGGLYSDGYVEASNCRFESNRASWGGGGVCVSGYGCRLMECVFENNINWGFGGGGGGGVLINSTIKSSQVNHCIFAGNTGVLAGGGLAIFNFGVEDTGFEDVITNCTFVDNFAGGPGGGFGIYAGNAVLTNCIFNGNEPGQLPSWAVDDFVITYSKGDN